MSFSDVLVQLGQSIVINAITQIISEGYISEGASATTTTAIVQSLRDEELVYLSQSGYTEKDKKMYLEIDENIKIGDEIVYNDEIYLIKNITRNNTYLKTILSRRENANTES